MTAKEIQDAINNAFSNLGELNAMLYDYWLSELYDDDGDFIVENWNEHTVKLMEDDVMNQHLAVEAF